MEEKKQLVFTKVNEDDVKKPSNQIAPSRSKRVSTELDNTNYIKIQLKHGVTIVVTKDSEEDYNKIETLQDVILLDKRKPNNIVGFDPPLFTDFINKASGTIKTHVLVGETVVCMKKFSDSKGHIPRIVKSLYLKALNNMTIIIATLSDDDFYIASRLEKIK